MNDDFPIAAKMDSLLLLTINTPGTLILPKTLCAGTE